MKALENFCKSTGFISVPIRFHSNGVYLRRKGFDVCNNEGRVIFELEPYNSRDGAKWLIRRYNGQGAQYVKRITAKLLEQFRNAKPSNFIQLGAKQ